MKQYTIVFLGGTGPAGAAPSFVSTEKINMFNIVKIETSEPKNKKQNIFVRNKRVYSSYLVINMHTLVVHNPPIFHDNLNQVLGVETTSSAFVPFKTKAL
jgi:hypothetical protein